MKNHPSSPAKTFTDQFLNVDNTFTLLMSVLLAHLRLSIGIIK